MGGAEQATCNEMEYLSQEGGLEMKIATVFSRGIIFYIDKYKIYIGLLQQFLVGVLLTK